MEDFILGRSPYQNQARNNGFCSSCFKNDVKINLQTGKYKWRCESCEKRQTEWQRKNRRR